jgi:hypothetical protein
MAENKTQATAANVTAFVDAIADPGKREDARTVCRLMERLSGEPPRMWGSSIVGFGSYHYKYDSGREGDSPRIGFSPRANALTLYIMGGFPRHEALMERLGKYKTGKSCLYLKQLADVDMDVLEELIAASLDHMRELYPPR